MKIPVPLGMSGIGDVIFIVSLYEKQHEIGFRVRREMCTSKNDFTLFREKREMRYRISHACMSLLRGSPVKAIPAPKPV